MAAATIAVEDERRGRRGLTIRLKLTLWYGCLFLLAGVLLIAINYFMVRNSLSVAPEKARAAVAEQFGIPPEWLERSFPAEAPGMGFEPGGGRIPGSTQPEPFQLYVETEDGVFVSVPELLREAQNQLKDEALRQLWIRSLVALAIITVLTFGLAWFVAGRMLRPLHAITSTARRLSGSTLHERIDLRGPRDELKELADTFDDMLGRLDEAFTAQREFVANASHELRTPLTIIRTEIDVALSDPDLSQPELQEMGAAVNEAVDRSEKLIDGLLVLARTENPLDLVDIDLAEIAAEEVELASAEADAQGLRLELDLQPAPVKGERSLLERMAGNLVENAIRHNTVDGWFSVKTRVVDDMAVLEVANGGPVIAPEDASRLFDRFYRPDRSRSRKTGGFGLGLSIVKSVATAHGGTVDLVAPVEGGLTVTVSLPLTAPGQSPPETPGRTGPAEGRGPEGRGTDS
ncbi:MAG: HAMP domain-containing protein [Actinomycetia bacterium]|nr:HAMP domain-containing protein [Actinomycetes bacterium]